MLLSSVTNDVKNTLMAEIFAGLYVREFRECGKLAKIKSQKRSLEYCLEPVTWNVIVTLRLTKSESTKRTCGERAQPGFVHSNREHVFPVVWFLVVGQHLVAAAASNTLINVVSANATPKLKPTRHCWIPFPTNNKEPNLNTRRTELKRGNR